MPPPRRRRPIPPPMTATFELIDGTKVTLAGHDAEAIADAAADIIQNDRNQEKDMALSKNEDLPIGTLIAIQHGPYRSVAEVIEIVEAGAVLKYQPVAHLVGFEHTFSAPNGTELTKDPMHGFLGRAHFHSADIVRGG